MPVPQNSHPIAKPHSAVAEIERRATAPGTGRSPRPIRAATIAKQTDCPAARCRSVHAMNRSNPSTVAGGGEMKRVTSSFVIAAKSAGASLVRSSRSVTSEPASSGSPVPPVVRPPFGLRTRHGRHDRLDVGAAADTASSPLEAARGPPPVSTVPQTMSRGSSVSRPHPEVCRPGRRSCRTWIASGADRFSRRSATIDADHRESSGPSAGKQIGKSITLAN